MSRPICAVDPLALRQLAEGFRARTTAIEAKCGKHTWTETINVIAAFEQCAEAVEELYAPLEKSSPQQTSPEAPLRASGGSNDNCAMNVSFENVEQQLAELHRREREGLAAFKAAVARAQQQGICLEAPAPVTLPIPSRAVPVGRRQGRRRRPEHRRLLPAPKEPEETKAPRAKACCRYCEKPLKQKRTIARGTCFACEKKLNTPKPKPTAAPPAPPPPSSKDSTAGEESGPPRLNGKITVTAVAQAAVYLIGRNGGNSMSARQLIEAARQPFPHLVEGGGNRESDFRVRLIDAARNGLLNRTGIGPEAVYSPPA